MSSHVRIEFMTLRDLVEAGFVIEEASSDGTHDEAFYLSDARTLSRLFVAAFSACTRVSYLIGDSECQSDVKEIFFQFLNLRVSPERAAVGGGCGEAEAKKPEPTNRQGKKKKRAKGKKEHGSVRSDSSNAPGQGKEKIGTKSSSSSPKRSSGTLLDLADDQLALLLLELHSVPSLGCVFVPNVLSVLKACIRQLGNLVTELVDSMASAKVISSSGQPSSTELAVEPGSRSGSVLSPRPPPLSKYCWGKIRKATDSSSYVFDSQSFGPVQCGIPPEIIKVYMRQNTDPPLVYVLPPRLFDCNTNAGDLEFPIFFAFFIKKAFCDEKKKVVMIGRPEQLQAVKAYFTESFFGPDPQHLYLDEDIVKEHRLQGYTVDFVAERDYLAYKDSKTGKAPSIDAFARFLPLSPSGEAIYAGPEADQNLTHDSQSSVALKVRISNGVIVFEEQARGESGGDGGGDAQGNQGEAFHVKGILDISESIFDQEEEGGLSSSGAHRSSPQNAGRPPAAAAAAAAAAEPDDADAADDMEFTPPCLGITFLGTGHGFAQGKNTTGFIIWINGQGVLVDPPVQTTKMLKASGIHDTFVTSCILTHCHSDHDSGLIQRLLSGKRCELFTTKTINESYRRKVNAILDDELDIASFYRFRQVKIGEKRNILGAIFDFDYALHTIPTLRFRLDFMGKSISYSADTHYSPRVLSSLLEQNIICPLREISLRQFVFTADLIIHEAGIAPIHTPFSELNELPSAIKSKLLIVHTTGVPETVERVVTESGGSTRTVSVPVVGLRIPETGVRQTIRLEVPQHEQGFARASQIMQMVSSCFFLRSVSSNKTYDLFARFRARSVAADEVIVKEGDSSDEFFIIFSGAVDVIREQKQETVVRLFRGDCFGEGALRREPTRRGATVRAYCNCQLYVLSSRDFHDVVSAPTSSYSAPQTSVEVDLARISSNRDFVREHAATTQLFSHLSPEQIDFLASNLEDPVSFRESETIFKQGENSASLYFIREGIVRLAKDGEEFLRLGPGDSFGEISLIAGLPRTASAFAHTNDVVLLELKRENWVDLLDRFSNVRFNVSRVVESRLKESVEIEKSLSKIKSRRSERR